MNNLIKTNYSNNNLIIKYIIIIIMIITLVGCNDTVVIKDDSDIITKSTKYNIVLSELKPKIEYIDISPKKKVEVNIQPRRYYNTFLKDYEDHINQVASKYNIDPDLIVSIAILESGHGTSYLAKSHNNLFGVKNGSYSSWEESIEYFGKLMSSELYRGKSLDQIAKIYCPPNHDHWLVQVRGIMSQFK